MGIYGHPTPKPSYLLGTPSQPWRLFAQILDIQNVSTRSDASNDPPVHLTTCGPLRTWVLDLEDYLPAHTREQLKASNEADGFEMVRKYIDSRGNTRV